MLASVFLFFSLSDLYSSLSAYLNFVLNFMQVFLISRLSTEACYFSLSALCVCVKHGNISSIYMSTQLNAGQSVYVVFFTVIDCETS